MTDPQEGQRIILLVEDEPLIAAAEERVLLKHGFQVLTASSGERAIQTVRDNGNIDLILMDTDLGDGMDGTEAAKIITAERDIPVIFLSNNTQGDVVEETGEVSSYGYVVKDSGNAVLIASVKMALRLHDAHRELKKREQALKESRQHLAVAFNSSPIGISLTRLSDGLFFDVNEALLHSLGYERDEIIGNNPISIGIWADSENRARMVAALANPAGIQDFETTFRTKTGELREALVTAKVVDVAHEQYILGQIRDITERRRAEEKARSSEERLRGLFETSKDSILIINQETGQVLGANPAACSLYGYSSGEFLALKIADLSAEPEKAEAAVGRSPSDIPSRLHQRKDGSLFPVEVSESFFREGALRLKAAFVRDVTARRKTEEELFMANFGIKSSISAVGFADLDGRVTFVNDSFLRLWGYDRADEVVGQHITESATLGAQGAAEAARSGGVYVGEGRGKRKDGSSFPVQVAVSLVKNDEGRPICTMASFIDITEQKQAEEKLYTSQVQALGCHGACQNRLLGSRPDNHGIRLQRCLLCLIWHDRRARRRLPDGERGVCPTIFRPRGRACIRRGKGTAPGKQGRTGSPIPSRNTVLSAGTARCATLSPVCT